MSAGESGSTGGAPSLDDVETDGAWSPEAERLISDVETLKAISDPLRLRVLETMVRRLDPPWSVKELASALGVPPTRLYHHVELLLERDLVRPAGRRLVSGIVETRYRVSALSLRLDRGLFRGSGDAAEAMHETLRAIFDGARDEIGRGLAAGRIAVADDAPEERRAFLVRGGACLSPERARELRARLTALLDEFGTDDLAGTAGLDTYGIVIALYPAEPPAAAAAEPEYPERPE